jgi:hypothetical protein
LVTPNRAVHLFTSTATERRWTHRISDLLEISVQKDDKLSPYICNSCKLKIVHFEKALTDLAAFKNMALSSSDRATGPQKRTQNTSGGVGVSPNTCKERPPSKCARKRLAFCE